jgi:hypothetical protein
VVMGFQMLEPYCSCLLSTVRYPSGVLNLPNIGQIVGSLSAFFVLEQHGSKKEANNHYSLLVPVLVHPNTEPLICTTASFAKDILDITVAELEPLNTDPLICTSASVTKDVFDIRVAELVPSNTDPLIWTSLTEDIDIDIDGDNEVTPRDASIPLIIHYFNNEFKKVRFNAMEEFQEDKHGTDKISSPGCLSNKTVDFFMTLYVHHFQTTERTLVYILSNTLDYLVRNIPKGMKESFGNREIRMSWWRAEQTTDSESACFTDEETKRFYGTEFFFFAVPWSFHWVLAIACFAGKCVNDKLFPDKQPCVFFFDSLSDSDRLIGMFKNSSMTLCDLINYFLNIKFSTTKFTSAAMPIFQCTVPQQGNGKDCGVCALEFAGLFLRSPNFYYDQLRQDAKKRTNEFAKQFKDFEILIRTRRSEYHKFLADEKASVKGFSEMFINLQHQEVEALIMPPKPDEKSGMKSFRMLK